VPLSTEGQTSRRSDAEVSAVIKSALDTIFRTEGESPRQVVLNDSLLSTGVLSEYDSYGVGNLSRVDASLVEDFKAHAWPASAYPKGFRYPRARFQSNSERDSLQRVVISQKRDTLPDAEFWIAFARK
jgi:hypothetical protein